MLVAIGEVTVASWAIPRGNPCCYLQQGSSQESNDTHGHRLGFSAGSCSMMLGGEKQDQPGGMAPQVLASSA